MIRSYVRGGAAALVALGLAAGTTAVSAGTAEAPATVAAPETPPGLPAVTGTSAIALAGALGAGLRERFPPAFKWDGQPTVTAAGDHYDVELPALKVESDDGARAEVGVIRLSLTPNGDGSWGVGLAVPPQITLVGADGKPEGEVTIGSQRFLGRWLPALGTFVKADGGFGDLKALSRKDKTGFEIGSVSVRTDLTEQSPGRWTGPSTLVLDKLSVVDEHGVQVARLGGAALEATVTGMDIAHAITLGAEPDPGAPVKEDAPAAARRHLAMLHGLFGGATAKLRLNDLSMTAPADGGAFSVGQVAVHGGIEGLNDGKSTVSLGYRHAGLKIAPSPGPKEFTPETVDLAIAATDLPNAGLWAAFERLFQPAPGVSEEQAGTVFAQEAQTALVQAGSKLRVDSLRLDTPAAAADLNGEARFDARSALGLTAGFKMVARGLDAAIQRLQPAPGAKVDEDTQSTMAVLSMVQVMGAPGKDEGGRDVRTYNLDLGADGKILLNGTDMSALLQAGQGGPGQGGGGPKARK